MNQPLVEPSFEEILEAELPELDAETRERVVHFRNLVLKENEIQNLTRLTSPRDFFEGHVLDVVHLLKSEALDFPALDLGSGAGVPGLLTAILGAGPWVLADSEQSKAEFLERTARELEFDDEQIRVVSTRAEAYLSEHGVESIVARAVGPLTRIYSWIKDCSTWNSLVLLKGPKWDEEWADFQRTGHRKKLRLVKKYGYTVGPEKKTRLIIRLERVEATE